MEGFSPLLESASQLPLVADSNSPGTTRDALQVNSF
jgi:hypothetical protein